MAKENLLRPSEELTLASRGYRLLRKLGEGSYANVYLAEFISNNDEKHKKNLACKVVDISKAPKDFVKKFLPRELDVLVRLNHPHVIHIHSIFQRKTKYFVFMRQAENGDMLEYILAKGPVSESQGRVWVRQLALGVQYLHTMEIAHRDLKCENCLITGNYNLKLADFGFARFVTDAQGHKLNSSTYCGSLSYAAPEVLRGMPYYPKTSDLWSIGVIVYVMLNKAMPFDDNNVRKLHEQQVAKRWKFRTKVADTLTEEVKTLIVHLLEPDVNKRWKINELINCEWFSMDPRLKTMNAAEEQALAQAQGERKKYIDSLLRKKDAGKKPTMGSEEFKIVKGREDERGAIENKEDSVSVTLVKD